VYQKTPGSAAGTCNTTYCHGGNSQTWTAVNTDATCVKCHGVVSTTTASYLANTDLAAPGYIRTSPLGTGVNTSGTPGTLSGGVSNDAKVGAHDTHLRGNGGYKTSGILCTDCHSVTSLTSSGHMNGSTSFTWSNLATNNGTLTPSYTSGACNNVYCHGSSFIVATRGTDTTPVWTDGTHLTNPAATMNTTDCNKCHQSPPTAAVNYNHSGVTLTANGCNACHQHDGAGATHIDGVLQAAGGACNSCHDYDVDSVTGDWGKSLKAVEGWGAHALHINHLKTVSGATLSATGDNFNTANYNAVCGVCHTRSSANHAMSGTPNTRTINFGDGQPTYVFSTGSTLTYNGVTGVSSATTPKTCSNVSCHFQPAPVWQGL
jgi:predicted CxxxxCH...CXXCH cytochrome family protein